MSTKENIFRNSNWNENKQDPLEQRRWTPAGLFIFCYKEKSKTGVRLKGL